MKKLFSFILSIVMIASVMTFFPLRSFAEEGGGVLPEFNYPIKSYSTFAETGIPYDEILARFPKILEIKYENGAMYVKDLGGDDIYYIDGLNSDGHEGELVNGYWKLDVSLETYNSGGYISMYTDSRSWYVQYDVASGKRGIISLDKYADGLEVSMSLYPKEGYGEQFVMVRYNLFSNVMVTDSYGEGVLAKQELELHTDAVSMWADYDSLGQLESINVRVYETDEDAYFLPGKGWSENDWEYVPVDPPTGFEDATLESLMAILPTDIGCEHRWSDPLCDVPSICAFCQRQKGEPLGHKWVSGDKYDTCSTCNGILYRISDLGMPLFDGRPAPSLKELGIDTDKIISKCIQKMTVKYENGVFMIPNIDGFYFDIRLSTKGYLGFNTVNGWNRTEVAEEDLKDLEITFMGDAEVGGIYYDYTFEYNHDGTLVYANLYDDGSGKAVSIMLDENTVEIIYPKDEDSSVDYTDIYENGILISQTVYNTEERVKVYYDSDLNVEKVRVYLDWQSAYFVPEKGWYSNMECTNPIDTPEGYEDKDAAYFAEKCPHTIDFCIHKWEKTEDGKECIKCGEKIVEEKTPVVLIIGIVASVIVLAAAVTVIAVKKKKSAKAE